MSFAQKFFKSVNSCDPVNLYELKNLHSKPYSTIHVRTSDSTSNNISAVAQEVRS